MLLNYQALFDASPSPYLVLDRSLNIATANRAYLESTHRELSDIVGRWAWDAFPTDPDTLAQSTASFERVIRTGEVDTMALTLPRFHVQQEVDNFWSTEKRNERWKCAQAAIHG